MRGTLRRIAAVAAMGAALLTAPGATAADDPGPEHAQANAPQVAGDPSADASARFPTNKQNAPTIAVDPTDPARLIAAANDEQRQPPCGPGPVRGATLDSDCSFVPVVGTSGVYTSADGGRTWTNRGLLDDQPSWQGAGVVSDGDPVVVFGPKPDRQGGFTFAHGARAYYCSLASVAGATGLEYIVVSASDDGGATWSAPVIGTTKTASRDFNDKSSLTVDTSPTSPFFGRVYLSWTESRPATGTGNGSEPVMVAVSADGARRFDSPTQLSPADNTTGNGRQGSSSAVGPDGTVYVAFEQGAEQVVAVSVDGGNRWSRPRTIGPVSDIADPIPGANFRTNSFPVVAADPRDGSTILYAAWATRTRDGGRVVVARSVDRGEIWGAPVQVSAAEGYAFFPGLDVASTGRVDVGYQALVAGDPTTFGTGNAAIDSYLVSSTSGLLWSSPQRVSEVSSDPAASAQNSLGRQFWGDYNTLVSDFASAWLIVTDSRRGVGCPAVDAYQRYLHEQGLAARGDMADRLAQRDTGVNPALADPSVKPAPALACPAQFGNTDVVVAHLIHPAHG